ncbi:MAG: hypothetical protein Q9M14_07155 [Mariprofundaceae bacterium]|nr:hypothetical protein [Mariprofundaceae bacterium]
MGKETKFKTAMLSLSHQLGHCFSRHRRGQYQWLNHQTGILFCTGSTH